jgi:hypothetical protein
MLALSLVVVAAPPSQVAASPLPNRWAPVAIPAAGVPGHWVLAPGSTAVGPIAIAIDGTLFAYADPAGDEALFRSVDGGRRWTRMIGVPGGVPIVDIVTDRVSAAVVYFATAAAVFKSTNAGATWVMLASAPAGHTINSIDVAPGGVAPGAANVLVMGTTGPGGTGDVFVLNEGILPHALVDMDFHPGIVDAVLAVALSPHFATDSTIIAVGRGTLASVVVPAVAPTGAIGLPNVGDQITITGAALDTGVIHVTVGSVSIATTGGATVTDFAGDGAAIATGARETWRTPAAGETVVVTATAAGTTATWTRHLPGTTAAMTADAAPVNVVIVTPAVAPTGAIGLPNVGDQITITGADLDTGVIHVTAGAVSIAVAGGATVTDFAGDGVVIAAGARETWRTPVALGTVQVTATAVATAGTWTRHLAGSTAAVTADPDNVHIRAKVGAAAWGGTIGNPPVIPATATVASIAFPTDFSITPPHANWFVGINDGLTVNQGIYFVGGTAFPAASPRTLIRTAQIQSLVVTGPAGMARILAGEVDAPVVHRSLDGGTTWPAIAKPPTGVGGDVHVVMAADYITSGRAWATAAGNEAGVSFTADFGVSWNQLGLINTAITTVEDLSLSGAFRFMATRDGADSSFWRFDGTHWERVWTQIATVTPIIEVSPHFATDRTVFLANLGDTDIWRSTNDGQTWVEQITDVPAVITGWVVINPTTVITGGIANVHRTVNNGLIWLTHPVPAAGAIFSLVLSPGFAVAGAPDAAHILAGDNTGEVYRSINGGVAWAPVGPVLPDPVVPLADVVVAFDPGYATNHIVYATTSDGGVFRFTIGVTPAWIRIDDLAGLPVADRDVVMGTGLVVSADGTLYATDTTVVAGISEGMSRSLDPTVAMPFFERANLDAPLIALTGLWLTPANVLWAISGGAVLTYTDAMAVPVVGGVATTPTPTSATFAWTARPPATDYEIQLNPRADFHAAFAIGLPDVPAGLTAVATAPDALVPGTTYFWRVRVDAQAPLRTRWSTVWNFTTGLPPPAAPVPLVPAPGATGVALRPTFQWAPVPGAVNYELVLSAVPGFVPHIYRATPTPAFYALPITLNHTTVYYWRVRALGAAGVPVSEWIASAFTTLPAPPPPPPPPTMPPPSASGVPIRPAFQWAPVPGAVHYQFQISTVPGFVPYVHMATPTTPFYVLPLDLEHGTGYYWRVRAIGPGDVPIPPWVVNVFTTVEAPPPPPPPPPPPVIEIPPPVIELPPVVTPAWVWVLIAIGAVLVIVVIVLIFRTRRV